MPKPILEMKHITMDFPGVRALDDVDFTLEPGEIHALIGENGAGKSTLMKILLGLYRPTGGEIYLNGQKVDIRSPHDALGQGISMIHQEISLVSPMTVDENIWLGREKHFTKAGLLDVRRRQAETEKLLERLHIRLDPAALVRDLSIASMQLVEIVRAVSYDARIIIMDEPTSALTSEEIDLLIRIMRELSAAGSAVIFISHKLEELLQVCHRVTVLRDGKFVASEPVDHVDQVALIRMMVGREIQDVYPRRQVSAGECILEAKNLTKAGVFKDISFSLHKGEILGFCGLMGAGRTEILEALFGIDHFDSGEVVLHGRPVRIRTPQQALALGIGMVTEDRLRKGIIHKLSVRVNLSISNIRQLCRGLFIQMRREADACGALVKDLQIRLADIRQLVSSLSGGNQQKVVLGRCLMTDPEILILDEPTRGIDVGSKAEIYKLIDRLASQGMGIIMVSSELPEVMGMSDRILVVSKGRITDRVERPDFDSERLMTAAFQLPPDTTA